MPTIRIDEMRFHGPGFVADVVTDTGDEYTVRLWLPRDGIRDDYTVGWTISWHNDHDNTFGEHTAGSLAAALEALRNLPDQEVAAELAAALTASTAATTTAV